MLEDDYYVLARMLGVVEARVDGVLNNVQFLCKFSKWGVYWRKVGGTKMNAGFWIGSVPIHSSCLKTL